MISFSVFAVLLCGALQISSAAPVSSGALLSTSLEVLSDVLGGKSLEKSTADRGITVADSILVITDALKAALTISKEVKNGADLGQIIGKSIEQLIRDYKEVFGTEEEIDCTDVERTLRQLVKKVEKVPAGDIDGFLSKIGEFEEGVLNTVAQDANDMLNIIAQNAQKLIEEAQKEIERVNKQHSSNILHNAIDALGSIAHKVVDTSNSINQGVHNIIGGTVNTVAGTAHKVIDTITGILQWGKRQ